MLKEVSLGGMGTHHAGQKVLSLSMLSFKNQTLCSLVGAGSIASAWLPDSCVYINIQVLF